MTYASIKDIPPAIAATTKKANDCDVLVEEFCESIADLFANQAIQNDIGEKGLNETKGQVKHPA